MSYGAGLLSKLAKDKRALNQETAEDKLEASRQRNALIIAEARAKKELEEERRRESAALLEAAEDAEARRIVDAMKVDRQREAEERASLTAMVSKGDVRAAAHWFYVDKKGEVQGPFWPKHMKDWFVAGFLFRDLLVAPCFDATGSAVPERDAMRPLCTLFREPLIHNAFHSAPGVLTAPIPPPPPLPVAKPRAPEPKRKRDDDADEAPKNWLTASIDRQKKGIHRTRHADGPAMIFEE
ncbi:hypothetical protein M885DRAFT_610359 [Pelagophyceae sp. CCMP2097]|nr:hypothetical protein M885DRAFT_610359 [Pelagophyceae sp. CCMP2097]